MTQQKKTLAWDFDDVLFPFLQTFFVTFHNAHYGSSFSFEDIFSFELEQVIGCDWHEKQRRIQEFYGSGDHEKMLPSPGALEAAEALSPYYRHVIITARPLIFEPHTRLLLGRHYPRGLFEDEIHFLDHYATKNGVKLSKGKKCVEIGAVACIEDAPHNAKGIVEEGIPVYLPDMPWNRGVSHPLIRRVFSLSEIVADLIAQETAPVK